MLEEDPRVPELAQDDRTGEMTRVPGELELVAHTRSPHDQVVIDQFTRQAGGFTRLLGSFPNPGDADRVRELFERDAGVDRLGGRRPPRGRGPDRLPIASCPHKPTPEELRIGADERKLSLIRES
jgi:hypothetical protein